jgi:hypothetical protein
MMRVFLSLGIVAGSLLGAAPLLAQSFLTGLVHQRQGNGVVPVPHARVEARSTATGKVLAEVTADDYGSYVLQDLPAGEVVVMVSHPRFHAASRGNQEKGARRRCPAQGSCGVLDFEMKANGELAVRVVDTLGQPVEEVTVTVSSVNEQDDPVKQPAGFLDGRGVLHISLPPGRYQVHTEPSKRLRGIQYEPTAAEIEFEHGQLTKAIEIILPSSRRYRVSGRVLGLETSDARRMMITLTPLAADRETDARPQRFGAPLDRSGYFALSGLPRGSYIVELTWFRGSLPPPHTSRGYLLRTITVEQDLRGLLLAAPSGVISN